MRIRRLWEGIRSLMRSQVRSPSLCGWALWGRCANAVSAYSPQEDAFHSPLLAVFILPVVYDEVGRSLSANNVPAVIKRRTSDVLSGLTSVTSATRASCTPRIARATSAPTTSLRRLRLQSTGAQYLAAPMPASRDGTICCATKENSTRTWARRV